MDFSEKAVMQSAHIFHTNEAAPGIYDQVFGGLFARVGFSEMVQIAFIIAVSVAICLVCLESITKRKRYGTLALLSGGFSFICLNFLINQPWDELFIFLRHSQHWAEDNLFSFNRLEKIEGIVDFLPYFIIGCLAKLGLPLFELAIFQSLLGGLLCLAAAYRLLGDLEIRDVRRTLILLVLSFFPPLCFNSAQGFATAMFAATIVWSATLLFSSKNKGLGYFVLSLVPLVRLEGALVVLLFWVIDTVKSRPRQASDTTYAWIQKALLQALLVNIPLLGLTLFRWIEFGHLVPTPIEYKSSFLTTHYLKMGIRNFFKDLETGMVVFSISALFIGFSILSLKRTHGEQGARIWRNFRGGCLWPLFALALFVLPYYFSGGDWFPHHWGRYLLPFSFYAAMVGMVAVTLAWGLCTVRERTVLSVSLLALSVPYLLHPQWNAFGILSYDLFGENSGKGTKRVHQLSQIGLHLKRTTRPWDKIASAEIATIMYFADREGIDLLGVTNPDIAKQPLILSDNLAFRRRKPELITEQRPAIVWAYDFTALYEEGTPDQGILAAVNKHERLFAPPSEFRFGGVDNLLQHGYQTVVVNYKDGFNTVYWVSPEAFPYHLQALRANGLRGGKIRKEVGPDIS